MELFTYYNLTESINADLILAKLEVYHRDYKIEYKYFEHDGVFKIIDVDLSDKEVSSLIDIFDNNDIIPDLDYDDSGDYDDLNMGDDSDGDEGYDY